MKFQHLTTHSENNDIVLFGRLLGEDNRSIAIWIKQTPYFVVKCDIFPDVKKYYQKCYGNVELPFSIQKCMGQDYTNFNEEKKEIFWKITCKNKQSYWRVKQFLSEEIKWKTGKYDEEGDQIVAKHNFNLPIYNDQVPLEMKYFIENDIFTSNIFEVEGLACDFKKTSCDIEIRASHITPVVSDEQAIFKELAYDIECKSDGIRFPSPIHDPIITIGVVTTSGQHVWTLGEPNPITKTVMEDGFSTDIELHQFQSECDMLVHFSNFIRDYDPDFIIGHNINRFDNDYFRCRGDTLHMKRSIIIITLRDLALHNIDP